MVALSSSPHPEVDRLALSAQALFSLDGSADDLARFLQENPDIAPGNSVRVVSQQELDAWMTTFTQAPASSIPINLMAGPGGHLQCVRVGSLRDGDYPVVKAALE